MSTFTPDFRGTLYGILGLLFLVNGCTPRVEVASPAEIVADTVVVHQAGSWIPVPARPLDFPQFAFTSKIPAEAFQLDEADSGEGTALRLTARFGGLLSPNAYAVLYFATPPHASDGSARASLLDLFQTLDVEPELDPAVPPCLWAEETFLFRSLREDLEGYACLAQKDGVPFYLYVQYPEAHADGMQAHLDVMLRHWRWRSDGTSLELPSP